MATPVICSYCEAENAPTAKFCGRCGRELNVKVASQPEKQAAGGSALVTCPYCTFQNPSEVTFCARCGRSLLAQESQPPPVVISPSKPAPKRRSRRGLWLGCLLVFLLVAGGAVAAFYLIPLPVPEPVAGLIGMGQPPTTTSEGVENPTTGSGNDSDFPTVTPFPTGTPKPTLTPLSPTPVGTPSATPTFTATPTVTGDPINPIQTSDVKVINEPWEQDGVSLTARTIDVRSMADRDDPAARVWFRLVNKTGERILIEIDWNDIHLEDSLGTVYVDYSGGGTTSQWIEPGANYDFDRHYSTAIEQPSRVPSDAAFVQVVVDSFSRVQNARWQLDINPVLKLSAPPAAGVAKAVGEVWEKDGLTLQLTDLQIHADGGGDAAARAWFVLTNTTNQVMLVDVDFGRIYLRDSFGRRFGDWEGGGVVTHSIDPGRTVEFNRYFSAMSGRFSRITRGAKFVTLVVENTAGQNAAVWIVDIDNRLSGATGTPAAPLMINQPWEESGLSLTARTIEIRGQNDGGDAAARVWFRLINKTGQRLLLNVDWNAIHLEDSLGGVYGEFYGEQATSFWIEPGAIYDFDRHYSTIVEQESRIPATAESVTIVVDSFAHINNARWKRDMAAKLVPQAAPAEGQALAIGEGWEQAGIMLRLTNLEVRTESDREDAAFRAWYEVINTTSQPVLVEVDYSRIRLMDSFGGRFGDWEGGGMFTRWLDPGETAEFNRYYSEMSGRVSRIARGSEFVVVQFENVAGIPSGMWQLDIAR